ncbi:MAG: metalloregulator ArsR/SmtB family transcription factor [Paracoccaceae bacterium]
MVEQNKSALSETLKAVGDPTRRAILTALAQEGPTRVTELAARYEMSLNSVSKHIKILEKASLVTRKTIGRVHLIEANLAPVDAVEDWFTQLRSIWDIRLNALENMFTEKENTMTELTLTTNRIINASPKAAFDAWLDPGMLAKFMVPGEGMSSSDVMADPVVGGRFSLIMHAGDQHMPHSGEYTEIVPHSRLVFTWESPFSVDGSTVTLTFVPKDGGTEVTLTHVKFADEQSRDNHHGGWTAILATLEKMLQ